MDRYATDGPDHWTISYAGECRVGGQMRVGWHVDDQHGERITGQGGVLVADYPNHERNHLTATGEALVAGLRWVSLNRPLPVRLTVRGDIRKILNLLTGQWRTGKQPIRRLMNQCGELIERLMRAGVKVNMENTSRTQNVNAAELCG